MNGYHVEHKGQFFTPNGKLNSKPDYTNDELSQAELQMLHDEKPKHYFAYIKESSKILQTRMGDVLGEVRLLYHYRSTFGDGRCNIRAKAVNGLYYYGVWFTDHDYCRIHAYKNQAIGAKLFYRSR